MGVARYQYSNIITTTCSHGVSFGFEARTLMVSLGGSGPIYTNFTTGVGTCAGFPISSGTMTVPFLLDAGFPFAGLGFFATSTGTTVNILALGG